MAKPYPGPWIIRTLLFSAGHSRRFMEKGLASAADCVVFDLEDAVPVGQKTQARELIREVLGDVPAPSKPVLVRINPLESGLTLVDLDGVACENLAGFVYPKAYCADDVKAFDAQLSLKERVLGIRPGHFELIVLIETPRAVLNAYEIAMASPRVVGLLFGCEDFLTDMEGFHGPDQRSLLVPRHLVSMAARAAGVVPIDTPFVQVHDDDGLRGHIQRARELGFEGMLVMSPHQIELARRWYTPSEEEVMEASEIVRLADEAASTDRGIAIYGDKFISPPTQKRARAVLKRSKAILDMERATIPQAV